MKYSIRESNGQYPSELLRYGAYASLANNAELEFWARIKELEGSLKFWKNEAKTQDAALQKYQERISDLEAWNEMLTETGHWIGQEEAFDLKVAVQKFLDYTRTGKVGDGEEVIHSVPDWQIQELATAISNCGPFKSYSLSRGSEKQL